MQYNHHLLNDVKMKNDLKKGINEILYAAQFKTS